MKQKQRRKTQTRTDDAYKKLVRKKHVFYCVYNEFRILYFLEFFFFAYNVKRWCFAVRSSSIKKCMHVKFQLCRMEFFFSMETWILLV